MQKLILTVGLPGSGKTTWAKSWVAQNPSNRVRVCRNEIRRMLGPSTLITEQREALISVIESTAVRTGLKRGYDVVIDAHHLNPKVVAKWNSYAEMVNSDLGIELQIEFVHLNTSPEECIARDAKRPGDESVGRVVIMKLFDKYLKKEPPMFDYPPKDGEQYVGVLNDKGDLKWTPHKLPKEDDMEW